MEYRLILGRQSFTASDEWITELWGVDPGQHRFRPADFTPKWNWPYNEFGYPWNERNKARLACAILLLAGVPWGEAIDASTLFAKMVIDDLPSPWGLKSKHIRAWLVNPLLPLDYALELP